MEGSVHRCFRVGRFSVGETRSSAPSESPGVTLNTTGGFSRRKARGPHKPSSRSSPIHQQRDLRSEDFGRVAYSELPKRLPRDLDADSATRMNPAMLRSVCLGGTRLRAWFEGHARIGGLSGPEPIRKSTSSPDLDHQPRSPTSISNKETNMSTQEARIEALERRIRLQRRWNIVLGTAVIAGGLSAAARVPTAPEVIQAKAFEVVNDEGKTVVTLRSSKGSGVIMNHDRVGRRTFLVSNAEGEGGVFRGQVRTLNADGKSLVRLGATDGGEGVLTTHGAEGRQVVRIGAADGSGIVGIRDRHGHALAMIAEGLEGGGVFTAFEDDGQGVSWTAPEIESPLAN